MTTTKELGCTCTTTGEMACRFHGSFHSTTVERSGMLEKTKFQFASYLLGFATGITLMAFVVLSAVIWW